MAISKVSEEELKQAALLKERNKTLSKLVNVEKDILIKSKDTQTAAGALTDQYRSSVDTLQNGIEGFTSSIFGGTLGGIINALTIGTLKRRRANAKLEKEKTEAEKKKTKEEKDLYDKQREALVKTLLSTEEGEKLGREALIKQIEAKELDDEKAEIDKQIIKEKEDALKFLKLGGEVEVTEEESSDLGGESTSTGGESTSTDDTTLTDVMSSIDFTNELLADGLFGSPPLLQSVLENQETDLDNQESKEDRKERLRNEKNKSKGGSVVKKPGGKDDDGMDLGSLAGIAKFLLPAGALAGATAMLGTGLSVLGAVALPLVVVGAAMKAIYDGFVGWMSAEDWGVSKVSGALGGFFGGAADGGIANAFMNAGKWAIMGAAIGSVVPVVGTIIGGLLGAAIGGILGFIGGKKLAEGFDAIGTWFKESFMAIWDVVMPDWVKQIDFQWTDIFPTMLVKLFKGEYFTVDVPSFSWYSLFPNFLVEWFKGTAEKISEKPWSWTDIFPKFLKDFFSGEIAKDTYVFSWTDLFPEWMVKIFDSTAEAFVETPFTWYSLFPDWLVNIIKGVKITGGTDAWEWTDLFPGWLTKVFKAGKEKGTTEKGFDWTLLLPDWMAAAWDSTKAIGEKTGITPLFEMIKKIFTDLFDQILKLIPGKETLDKVMKVVDDPVGALKDAGKGISNFVSSINPFSSDKPEGKARGGFIVNKPTYLPSSGIVVGEHGTYSGSGAAYGGIADGGPEAVIPLSSTRAGAFIDPMAKSVAGQVMNRLQMERMSGGAGSDASVVTGNDMSTNQVSNNTTVINNPSPIGPRLPDEGRDFVSKVA